MQIILAALALFLAARNLGNGAVLIYWVLVTVYWVLNYINGRNRE